MEFDLTTVNGRNQAKEVLKAYGMYVFPQLFVLKQVFKLISPSSTIKDQKKTAIELIKAGRDNNVDSMEVTVDQTAGIDIGANVEGVPIKAVIGKNGKMTLKVKYKNP